MSDVQEWWKSSDEKNWWANSITKCPVCGFQRGDHFNAYCPTAENRGPFADDVSGKIDMNKVRGRYGIPYPGANKNGAAATSKGASGCKCTRCLEWYEYAVPVEKFVCYGCRH